MSNDKHRDRRREQARAAQPPKQKSFKKVEQRSAASKGTADMHLGWKLGHRDALAEVCMTVRAYGIEAGLREIAKALLNSLPDHPHAKWVLENTYQPVGPKLELAIAYEITFEGHTWWLSPNGTIFHTSEHRSPTKDELRKLQHAVAAGATIMKEHVCANTPPTVLEIVKHLSTVADYRDKMDAIVSAAASPSDSAASGESK